MYNIPSTSTTRKSNKRSYTSKEVSNNTVNTSKKKAKVTERPPSTSTPAVPEGNSAEGTVVYIII